MLQVSPGIDAIAGVDGGAGGTPAEGKGVLARRTPGAACCSGSCCRRRLMLKILAVLNILHLGGIPY